jgi:hypothetical protein
MVKPHHKPLHAHRFISLASCVFLFVAFLLMLLVGLSLPIIKSIYILQIFSTNASQPATTIATKLNFGVWGVCAVSEISTEPAQCFGPMLGYTIPPEIASLVGLSTSIINTLETSILVFLIIHIVSACFTLLAVVTSLFLASHAISIFSLVLTILSLILGVIVFALDVVLVVAARSEVPNLSSFNFGVGFGNGIWLVLVSLCCTFIGMIFLSARVCYCCGVRRYAFLAFNTPLY